MLLMLVAGATCKTNNKSMNHQTGKQEKILFINGSPNRDGNTAALAKVLLEGREYETLNLTDYRINVYGQTLDGDQFDEVLKKMKEADVVVMGSPVYWHNICASVRVLLERFYGPIEPGCMASPTRVWRTTRVRHVSCVTNYNFFITYFTPTICKQMNQAICITR